MRKMTLEEIKKRNPNIDEEKLKESLDLSEELRRQGVKGRRYGLASPFGGRKAKVTDVKEDKCSLQLTRQ